MNNLSRQGQAPKELWHRMSQSFIVSTGPSDWHENMLFLFIPIVSHRDLWPGLNNPLEIPPVPYEPEQLKFCLY